MSKNQPRVQVARDGKILAEYANLQLPSLLETGSLRSNDHCFDADSQTWVPLEEYIKGISGFAKKGNRPGGSPPAHLQKKPCEPEQADPPHSTTLVPWMLAFFTLAAVVALGLLVWFQRAEINALRDKLTAAQESKSRLQKQYDLAVLAAQEDAGKDIVRGRAILRDASGKRAAPPGIKIRLFSRKAIEAHLEARHAAQTPETGNLPSQLALHYMKDLPAPIETTTTDSDGRFEFKVPEPGEYVIQSSLISAKTREMRLWFVIFNSRDPLNTPVDINDSNVVRQFDPLLMLSEGR